MKPHRRHHPLLTALALTLSILLLATAPAHASGASKPPAIKPADTPAAIAAGLKSHDRALHLTTGWIRDPYIVRGPDNYYYLTGTTPDENDPREQTDPYNTGLGPTSIVGPHVRLWRSKDLIDWEYRGIIFSLTDSANTASPKAGKKGKVKNKATSSHSSTAAQPRSTGREAPPIPQSEIRTPQSAAPAVLWAPELHWTGDRWALVHCPGHRASFALGPIGKKEPGGPWTQPFGANLGTKHDPSLFKDPDGPLWMIWNPQMLTFVTAPLNKTLTDWAAAPAPITPSGSRLNKTTGETLTRIGHEGAGILKIANKYIFIGTAWSTDTGRKGSYNLYYTTADTPTGPYGPRKFLGRFLGHGYPFQTPDGNWWCTAFYNANVPPISRENIETRDLSSDAHTINPRGTTIVPLDIRVLPSGDIHIRAKDPAYATPGPDEAQKF